MRLALLLLLLTVRTVAADVTLAFELRWAGKAIEVPSTELRTAHAQSLRLTRFSALVSGVTLTRRDGSTVALNGQYGLLDAARGRGAVFFQNVPDGDYTGIGFQLGLPATINHGDSSRWPAAHPLNPLTNHLHWSWQGEYIFAAFEGRWTDAHEGGTIERGFSYHIVGDDHLMPLRFATTFKIVGPTTLRFALELSKPLGAQALASDDGSDSTHSAANDPVVTRMVSALQRSFFWLMAEATPASVNPGETRLPVVANGAADAEPLPFHVPAGFPAPSLPEDNPLTGAGVALGEALFIDRRLSGNSTQACVDCHSSKRAFSDRLPLSRGADGKPGTRNAMPLFNLAWSPSYAWDGSKPRIRDQAIAAMTNPLEMHADPATVVARLAADSAVAEKFRAAFGSTAITIERIGLALEQTLLATVSANSKFDRAIRGAGALTEEEKEGFALFMTEFDPARGRRGADCFHCHGGPLFTDYDFKNNGLDATNMDRARAAVTARPDDVGKFKTPSLRNIAVTAPYMHDGRFATLEEVVAHYDHAVQRTSTLDPNLAKHPVEGLKLSADEQRALVAFLRTLTDARWDTPERVAARSSAGL